MKLLLGVTFLLTSFSIQSSAQFDSVSLKPGTAITIYSGPTIVVCEDSDHRGFDRYCICEVEGFSKQYYLRLVIDADGTTNDLGNYDSQDQCEKSLHNNPVCENKRSK